MDERDKKRCDEMGTHRFLAALLIHQVLANNSADFKGNISGDEKEGGDEIDC